MAMVSGDPVPQSLLSPPITEKYVLDGSGETIHFEDGRNVVISFAGEENVSRDRDSGRVQTKSIAELKTASPNPKLLTAHGELVASCLRLENNTDAIRVMNKETKARHLIKLTSAPMDFIFAPHANLLALIDAAGELQVLNVTDNCEVSPFVNVTGVLSDEEGNPRLSWCPYSPEHPDDPTDVLHFITISKGRKVSILNLSTINDNCATEQVQFSALAELDDAIYTAELEKKVTISAMSPDATAVAVGTESGMVSFYVTNEKGLKFAHNWDPRLKTAVSHLHYLDKLTREGDNKDSERFWKYCLVAGEGGRRLALFECVEWSCLGSLRFDSELEAATFSIHVDPDLRYVHVLDTDGANIFCIELHFLAKGPNFVSITQITFCRPLASIVPYAVVDDEKEEDIDLDDTDDNIEEENNVTIRYVAMSAKSLVHLDVHLKKTLLGSENGDERNSFNESEKPDIAYGGDPSFNYHPSTSEMLHVEPSSSHWNTMDRDELDQHLSEIASKIDQLSFRVERAESERKTSATNENLLQILQQFKEEFSLREDRLMANISDLIETSRAETLNAVRHALGENQRSMEAVVLSSQQRVSEAMAQHIKETVRDTFVTYVVPAIGHSVTQLFAQLNETFRLGLDQFFQQLQRLQGAVLAATPAPSVPADRQVLLQMMKSEQAPMVLELVLNQADHATLEFICTNVDPDDLFSAHRMQQSILLSLLQQLTINLDSNTDNKFRYFEHILEQLRVDDDPNMIIPELLEDLARVLTEVQNRTSNKDLKRQARLLHQVVRGKLRN